MISSRARLSKSADTLSSGFERISLAHVEVVKKSCKRADESDVIIGKEHLGMGGEASVHLATRVNDETPVAVKVFYTEEAKFHYDQELENAILLRGSMYFLRLLGQTTVPKKSVLPHVPSSWRPELAGMQAAAPALVYEYIPEGTLEDVLACTESHLSNIAKLIYCLHTASAVHYLHSHNVLHRDLKLANIFVRTKLSGRSASELLAIYAKKMPTVALGDLAQTGPIDRNGFAGSGTLVYRTCTCLEGIEYGIEVDLHAFGIMVWEAFTEKVIFNGMDNEEIEEIIRTKAVDEHLEFPDGFDMDLKSMILKSTNQRDMVSIQEWRTFFRMRLDTLQFYVQ